MTWLEEIKREILHYVPFMTGYEKNVPFIAACGRDVTYGFFYTSPVTFCDMPLPAPRCPDCMDMVDAGTALLVLGTCLVGPYLREVNRQRSRRRLREGPASPRPARSFVSPSPGS